MSINDEPILIPPSIYFQKLSYCINKKDGYGIAKLLTFDYEIPDIWKDKDFNIIIDVVQTDILNLFENISKCHIIILNELIKEEINYDLILDNQSSIFCDVLSFFTMTTFKKEFTPLIRVVASDLRKMAYIADINSQNTGNGIEFTITERLVEFLMSILRTNPFAPNFITPGSLAIANQLFQSYYSMKKYNLAMPLIKSFEQNPNYNSAIIEDLINYRYLIGRFQLLVKDYKNALLNLKYAFDNCPQSMSNNRKLILSYLCTCYLALGILSTRNLSKEFNLDLYFNELITSIYDGNVKLYKSTIKNNKNKLILNRLYLVVIDLKNFVLLSLYHKIFHIIKSNFPRVQIPIIYFQNGRNFSGNGKSKSEFDKICSELSVLINDGYIKGYISVPHKKIVFFKDNPFPSVSENSFNKYQITLNE